MYKVKRIEMFEDVRLDEVEIVVNEHIKNNTDKMFDVDLKITTFKDEKGLDVVLYTYMVKEVTWAENGN